MGITSGDDTRTLLVNNDEPLSGSSSGSDSDSFELDLLEDGDVAPPARTFYDVAPAVSIGLWISTGIFVFTWTNPEGEPRTWLDALYLQVQITTTIGYGDVCPTSQAMKLFLGIYLTVGVVVAAMGITKLVERIMSGATSSLESGLEARHLTDRAKFPMHAKQALTSGLIYMLFLLIGTLYYSFVSKCACTGCDTSRCEETGGSLRTVIDAFYMSCATLTTVGFGDESPQSIVGRSFAIGWMSLGVVAMANFISDLIHMKVMHDMSRTSHKIHKHTFDKMDSDQNGTLSKFEYVSYMLVTHGLVNEDCLTMLIDQFEKLDTDGTGELQYHDVGHKATPRTPGIA